MARRSARRANSGAALLLTARRPVSSKLATTDLPSPQQRTALIASVRGRRVKRRWEMRLRSRLATPSQARQFDRHKESPGSGTRGFPFQPPEELFGRRQPYAAGRPSQFAITAKRWIAGACGPKATLPATIGENWAETTVFADWVGGNSLDSGRAGDEQGTEMIRPAGRRQLVVFESFGSRVAWRAPAHPEHHEYRQRRQPDHARAIAVIWIGECPAHGGIGEDCECDHGR